MKKTKKKNEEKKLPSSPNNQNKLSLKSELIFGRTGGPVKFLSAKYILKGTTQIASQFFLKK